MKNEKDLTEIKLPEQIEELFNAIVKLDNVEDCYSFFDDLCTYKEIEQMAVCEITNTRSFEDNGNPVSNEKISEITNKYMDSPLSFEEIKAESSMGEISVENENIGTAKVDLSVDLGKVSVNGVNKGNSYKQN